jgi:heptosyltransferase-3
MDLANKRILISKTNQIGDVLFALPIASVLKKHAPNCKIVFLGRDFTRHLIELYKDVDEFADWGAISLLDEQAQISAFKALDIDIIIHVQSQKKIAALAKKAKISTRIGTSHRLFHWFTCNKLVNIGRKKSPLHETQLDLQYLKAFKLPSDYSLNEITEMRGFKPLAQEITSHYLSLLDPIRFNLILHPKTRGQHIEWPLSNFAHLIQLLPADKFKIFITGSTAEGLQVSKELIQPFPHVVDLTGKTSLNELMHFIAAADGLIAASTGPVHLAAAFGIFTLGLYAPIRPFDAGRWGPVGTKAQVLSLNKNCNDCRYLLDHPSCHCIANISPTQVLNVLLGWLN